MLQTSQCPIGLGEYFVAYAIWWLCCCYFLLFVSMLLLFLCAVVVVSSVHSIYHYHSSVLCVCVHVTVGFNTETRQLMTDQPTDNFLIHKSIITNFSFIFLSFCSIFDIVSMSFFYTLLLLHLCEQMFVPFYYFLNQLECLSSQIDLREYDT